MLNSSSNHFETSCSHTASTSMSQTCHVLKQTKKYLNIGAGAGRSKEVDVIGPQGSSGSKITHIEKRHAAFIHNNTSFNVCFMFTACQGNSSFQFLLCTRLILKFLSFGLNSLPKEICLYPCLILYRKENIFISLDFGV